LAGGGREKSAIPIWVVETNTANGEPGRKVRWTQGGLVLQRTACGAQEGEGGPLKVNRDKKENTYGTGHAWEARKNPRGVQRTGEQVECLEKLGPLIVGFQCTGGRKNKNKHRRNGQAAQEKPGAVYRGGQSETGEREEKL